MFLLVTALSFFALTLFLYLTIDLEDGSPSLAYDALTIEGVEVFEFKSITLDGFCLVICWVKMRFDHKDGGS